MTDTNLTQSEADALTNMEKHRADDKEWPYPGLGDSEYPAHLGRQAGAVPAGHQPWQHRPPTGQVSGACSAHRRVGQA